MFNQARQCGTRPGLAEQGHACGDEYFTWNKQGWLSIILPAIID
ncbi:hypothetical protein [Citrobacter sp. JGM124]|nr:hypothetical protein [Citrobacter sp. JGM124]